MTDPRTRRYDTPSTVLLPVAAVLVPYVIHFGALAIPPALGSAAGVWLLRRRCGLDLLAEEATVREPRRETVVDWASVTGVRRGSWWRGGLVLDTTRGPQRCPAPTSWWGGPAPGQVAEVEVWWLAHRRTGSQHGT